MESISLGQRLKSLRKQRKMSQAEVGAAIGLTQTAYGRYETGERDPDTDTLAKIAQLFGVSIDYLMGVAAAAPVPENLPSNLTPMSQMPFYYVPVARDVVAGVPMFMEQNYRVYVDGPRQADFALVLEDDSMSPSYYSGDVVYVCYVPHVDDGEVAVVDLGGKCALRRFYRIKNGIQLVSDDPRFAPNVYLGDEAEFVRVLGIVVGFTRMYKRPER